METVPLLVRGTSTMPIHAHSNKLQPTASRCVLGPWLNLNVRAHM